MVISSTGEIVELASESLPVALVVSYSLSAVISVSYRAVISSTYEVVYSRDHKGISMAHE